MNTQMPHTPPPMSEEDRQQDEKARSINKKWKAVMLLYTSVAAGLVLYWEFNEGFDSPPTGLNRYIYDGQVSILKDSYYPVLDIMLSILVLLIPMFIVKLILEKVTGVKIENPNYRR